MNALRFRFTGPGINVVGTVQGNGGVLSSLAVLQAQQALAQAGRRLGVYEPAAGCVCVFPEYSAHGNGPRVNVPLSIVTISAEVQS